MNRFPGWMYFLVTAIVLSGCTDIPTETHSVSGTLEVSASTFSDDELSPIEPLLRSLAAALADDSLRDQLFSDLRDSPFPHKKLPLSRYFTEDAGRYLLSRGAKAVNLPEQEVQGILSQLENYELIMPVEQHRLSWRGTPDIVVAGSHLQGNDLIEGLIPGYTTDQKRIKLDPNSRSTEPILVIRPSRTNFGDMSRPMTRSSAKNGQVTISTPEEEFRVTSCDWDTAIKECGEQPGPGTPGPGGLSLPSGFMRECFVAAGSSGDTDSDGVLDQCEYELAHSFRPYLAVSTHDADLRREEYWAVRLSPTYPHVAVQIFYAPSYYYDHGWINGSSAHVGDSEWMILEVRNANGKWYLDKAKLSAHWGAPTNSTETYSHSEFTYPSGVTRTRPLVFVSETKHANYNNGSNCGWGGWGSDKCSSNVWNVSDPFYSIHVTPSANLGQSWAPMRNCVSSRGSSVAFPPAAQFAVDPSRLECYWNWDRFAGWMYYYEPADAGPYAEALEAHGF